MPHIGPHVTLNDPAFIHDTVQLFGKVTVGEGPFFWPYAVTRVEMHEIIIGARTNIQDHAMIHVGYATPTLIGADCSVTHRAVLHGCTLGDRVLVGIGATVMDGAVIGNNSILAGHSIVTEYSVFSENAIIAGSPAKLVKTRDNTAANLKNAAFYHLNALNYAKGIDRLSSDDLRTLG